MLRHFDVVLSDSIYLIEKGPFLEMGNKMMILVIQPLFVVGFVYTEQEKVLLYVHLHVIDIDVFEWDTLRFVDVIGHFVW